MNKYKRPYCEDCKLTWGRQNIGLVFKCSQCGESLVLKSFNPWPKAIIGVLIVLLGLTTLLLPIVPVIWIGGFIWGVSKIYNAFKQWKEVKKLDKESKLF